MHIAARSAEGLIEARAWGEGAPWLLEHLPRMLGADDDVSGFDPKEPALAAVWKQHRHWRMGATDSVFDNLLPTVIEQKVTGKEAFASYRHLVLQWGEQAPGPAAPALWVPPDARTVSQIPSWQWLKLSVDQARSRALVGAATRATTLERKASEGSDALDAALLALPGIGRWTSAEIRSRACGDADAVSFGDYHVAKDVGWALVGREVDDEELEGLLEPFRPHRRRVQTLVAWGNLGRPRRGPRMAPRSHLP